MVEKTVSRFTQADEAGSHEPVSKTSAIDCNQYCEEAPERDDAAVLAIGAVAIIAAAVVAHQSDHRDEGTSQHSRDGHHSGYRAELSLDDVGGVLVSSAGSAICLRGYTDAGSCKQGGKSFATGYNARRNHCAHAMTKEGRINRTESIAEGNGQWSTTGEPALAGAGSPGCGAAPFNGPVRVAPTGPDYPGCSRRFDA